MGRLRISFIIFFVLFLSRTAVLTPKTYAAVSLSASYSTSGQPTSFTAGSTATYTVTATNTGSATWLSGGTNPVHLGVHFMTSGGGCPANCASLITNQRFVLPADVPVGASATISVTAQVPGTAGSYVLEDQMVQELVAWFPQYVDSTVTASTGSTTSACSAPPSNSTVQMNACMQYVVTLINQHRASVGVAPLTLDPTQSNVNTTNLSSGCGSWLHSYDMAASGSIWHVNASYPNESFQPPYTLFCAGGWSTIGENVAEWQTGNEQNDILQEDTAMWNEGISNCATTVSHACNMINSNFTHVGVGLYVSNGITWYTTDFWG